MELWIPSRVNLFPHHLAASDRMIRFHLISRYAWRREIEGWVLELTCANEKKSFVSIPNDVVRKQVEEVLEKAGTAKDGLAPEEAARRRETDEWVASKLEEFRHGTRKFGLWCLLWFYIVLGACGILNLIYLYYFHKNNLILGIGLIVAFAGLFGSRVVETRFIKKLARSQGLACTHCAKPMTLVGLAHLRKTGKCLYCGKVLSFKAEADV